ncbi:putative gustatory receptor 93c [Drosophila guanche]|uniref:Gustatory receptor n=1 Tax=Drosophila guanche TaxID=7266 RepID=A0A3B0KA56_DROGU|nr:putative gustatory receptor 93c [Drosophila guanche]SPP82949.1 blast:Putative gustatory receptor 93c [Drosophila guanche]
MFGVLREMSASKLSAGILRVMYCHARLMGMLSFKVEWSQRRDKNGQTVMQLRAYHCPWLMWFCAIYRIVAMGIFGCLYCLWIQHLEDYMEKVSHVLRIIIITLICIYIVRLQLLYRTETVQLCNASLLLFRRVRALPSRKSFVGYGGRRELLLLLLSLSCRIHELVFLFDVLVGFSLSNIVTWWCSTLIIFGTNMLMYISFVYYLSLGILYSELNDFVRCELRGQLQSLQRRYGLQPGRHQLRTVRRKLDECLALYREIYCLATTFQKLFDAPFFLGIIHNYIFLGVAIYKLTVDGWFDEHKMQLCLLITKVILDFLLVTLSVQGAMTQFGVIRRLSLENCAVSDHKDWHTTFDMFVTHLNLYEFRVRPLGLFDVSNELVLVFLSALFTFVIYILQYKMKSKEEIK